MGIYTLTYPILKQFDVSEDITKVGEIDLYVESHNVPKRTEQKSAETIKKTFADRWATENGVHKFEQIEKIGEVNIEEEKKNKRKKEYDKYDPLAPEQTKFMKMLWTFWRCCNPRVVVV